jgi:hypothetical protein
VANGVIGTMWGSSQGGSRNYPYVRVVRFNEGTKAVIDEPDIWNANFAWIYPAVSVDDRGHIAGVVFYGGNTYYPNMATLIWDDLTSTPVPPWEVYQVVGSSVGATEWGDYYTARRHGVAGNTWVGTGQYLTSNSTTHTYYLWFGRFRDGIESPPNASKSFIPSSVVINQTTTLYFSVANPNTWASLTGVGFTDTLPAGLVVATPNGLSGSCGGGAITATAGSNAISLSGATLGASASCFFSVNVTVKGTGFFFNATSAISSNEGGSGSPAFASLSAFPNAVATHDFNADGYSDIAWRENGGTAAMWLMNGANVVQAGGFGVVPTNWQLVGQRDFDGDGKYDWLWYDVNTGTVGLWLLNGLQTPQKGGFGSVPGNWTIVGTGDFNGDGNGDILWRDGSSGTVALWLLNGFQILQKGGFGSIPLNWSVAGTGDFNGDGFADILWRDGATGTVAIWFLNGLQILQSGGFGSVQSNWVIVGTGDFNGDGMWDILWRDTSTGTVAVWLLNGLQVLQKKSLFTVPSNWVVAETGDFNSDGMSDILWRDTAGGGIAIWFMNGTQVSQTVQLNVNVGLNWTIQGLNAD